MNIPEGYAQAPTGDDHRVKLAVPVPGRDEPILIDAPKIAWMTPKEHLAVRKFADEVIAAEQVVDKWHEVNDALPEEERADYPEDEAKRIGRAKDGEGDRDKQFSILRELKLRWLKAHISAADYRTLTTSKEISEGTISWIVDQLKSSDVSLGESAASSSS